MHAPNNARSDSTLCGRIFIWSGWRIAFKLQLEFVYVIIYPLYLLFCALQYQPDSLPLQ
jgi:hypothetical protein